MSRNLIFTASLLLFLPGFLFAGPVEIKGVFTNASTHKKAYLYEFFGSDAILRDSARVTNGQFSFSYPQAIPRGFYKISLGEQFGINLILGTESIEISGDLANTSSLHIKGSKENEIYNRYKIFSASHNEQLARLDKEAGTFASLQRTDPALYQQKIAVLIQRFDSLTNIQQTYFRGLIAEDGTLFISKFLSCFLTGSSYNAQNFFNPEFFKDDELFRGDMLVQRINLFFQNYIQRNIEAWQEAANYLVSISAGTKNQELVFQALIGMFQGADPDFARSLAVKYNAAFPASGKAESILAAMPKGTPMPGDMAPDIKLAGPDGKPMALSSLKGQVVLIDFWASWCGPCRQENPNVVRVFNKYKDKGFMIYGVSLDNDRTKWLNAIEKDKLTWHHVSDLRGWSSQGAATYSVSSIPATFLIDRDGKIIAKNLRGEQLEQALEKIFQ